MPSHLIQNLVHKMQWEMVILCGLVEGVHRLLRVVIYNGDKAKVCAQDSIVHCKSSCHIVDGLDSQFCTLLEKLRQPPRDISIVLPFAKTGA